jgi:hypothetical protein
MCFNWSVFITVAASAYCAVRTGSLNQADTVSSLKGQSANNANLGNVSTSDCEALIVLQIYKTMVYKFRAPDFRGEQIFVLGGQIFLRPRHSSVAQNFEGAPSFLKKLCISRLKFEKIILDLIITLIRYIYIKYTKSTVNTTM